MARTQDALQPLRCRSVVAQRRELREDEHIGALLRDHRLAHATRMANAAPARCDQRKP